MSDEYEVSELGPVDDQAACQALWRLMVAYSQASVKSYPMMMVSTEDLRWVIAIAGCALTSDSAEKAGRVWALIHQEAAMSLMDPPPGP